MRSFIPFITDFKMADPAEAAKEKIRETVMADSFQLSQK